MSSTTAGIIFLAVLVLALALAHVPLGDYMYRVYTSEKHTRAERVTYRLIGANPESEQTWGGYARSMLAFSAVSVLFLFVFQLVQDKLPLHLHNPATPMTPALAWNTAVSFITNTNWQNYSGESTDGHLVQMAGLAVQNFASAAVGIAVAIAVVRGFARRHTGELGNFWVDLVRGVYRILLPVSIIAAIVLIGGGAIQNFHLHDQIVNTLAGTQQTIIGGPVASQEAIKEFGTNGGGFFNANSSHPFENPTTWTNWFEIFLLLVISFSLPRTFGRMVGSNKQGYAIAAVMAVLAFLSVGFILWTQLQHHGTVPTSVGSAFEGMEQRFGVANSSVFGDAATLTSTGAVDSMHDSYTSLGGMVAMFNMQLGEVAPGGTGSGLYGILVLAVITVFVAGLMVGRTPEYLGKKINAREIKLASIYFLTTPLIVLVGSRDRDGAARRTGRHGQQRPTRVVRGAVRVHLGANNNGSAFAGLSGNTVWYNTALGLAITFGRFLPMIFVLALAGSLARQGTTPQSLGTLPTHRPQFVGMVAGVTVILVALTFLPMLALGPLAEGIH